MVMVELLDSLLFQCICESFNFLENIFTIICFSFHLLLKVNGKHTQEHARTHIQSTIYSEHIVRERVCANVIDDNYIHNITDSM